MMDMDQRAAAPSNAGSARSVVCAARGVTKAFGSTRVLEDVDLTIGQGEAVALMGPSGSGKSTLLNCLSGIDQPDQGTIVISDLDVTARRKTWVALRVLSR